MSAMGTGSHEFRSVPCACGGYLSAFNNPADIHTAVVSHQETERHTTWSVRTYGRSPFGPRPTFVPPPDASLPIDLSRLPLGTGIGTFAAGRRRR